jgi:hypothetical protein
MMHGTFCQTRGNCEETGEVTRLELWRPSVIGTSIAFCASQGPAHTLARVIITMPR